MTRRRNNTEDNDHITHPWGIYSLEGFDNTRTIVSSLKCCLVSYQCPLISMRETTNQNYLLQTDGATKFCYPNLPFETLIQKWCKVSQYILANAVYTCFKNDQLKLKKILRAHWDDSHDTPYPGSGRYIRPPGPFRGVLGGQVRAKMKKIKEFWRASRDESDDTP